MCIRDRSLARCDKLAGQSQGPCDKLATAGGDGDRHVGITPVRITGALVCYPHMPIGMLWIYRLLFVFCVSVRRIFCKGYLERGLA